MDEKFIKLTREQVNMLKGLIMQFENARANLQTLLKFIGIDLTTPFEIVDNDDECGIKILPINKQQRKLLKENEIPDKSSTK